ncbi:FAS1 domain-containing protein [Artemisia annua]|uniref:FAS1 domain-containing protein n=1 Tax=Artemisia annua TaxID=35608 RepID=A0A2U1NV08_ARTAN|nr:FAS1 domain-containing protein [Artemisia annua]
MMIEMLPQDLSFTVFVPSDVAFGRDLGLRVNDSLVGEKANDTYAILTRVLSFTVVPWKIHSQSVPYGEEMTCDSLSGFKLYVSKDEDGMLVVNRVRSKRVDLRKGEMVVHVMGGVIMEAEFEQSVRPDDDEED